MNKPAGVTPVAGRFSQFANKMAHLAQAVTFALDRVLLPQPQPLRIPVHSHTRRVGPVCNKT